MRKIEAIILCMVMCFSVVSCGGTTDAFTDTQSPISSEQVNDTISQETTDTDVQAGLEQDTQKDTERDTEKAQLTTYKLKDNVDKFKLHGRMSVLSTGITCDFSASGIEFNAYVTGDVTLKVTATKDTYFTVWVDGKRSSERLYAPKNTTELKVASFEEAGEHTIRILKQSEAAMSLCVLNTLTLTGELREPPTAAKYFIEIIGDSITCGQGNLVMKGDEGQGKAIAEDGTQTFCFLAADSLGADCSIIGRSGIGIDKGYTEYSEMDFYPKTSYCRS